jgi:hypothetical protein
MYWTRDVGPAYNPQGLPVGSNTFTNWSDFLPLKWYGAGNTAAPGVLPSDAALGASYKGLIDGQLAQMRSNNGAETIKLPVYFGRYQIGTTAPADCLNAGDANYKDPFRTYPTQPFFMGHLLPSNGGAVSANCKASIRAFLAELQSLGFKEVHVDFAPLGGNYGATVGNAPSSFPDEWVPGGSYSCGMSGYSVSNLAGNSAPISYFNENYNFIKDFINSVLVPSGMHVKVDLGGEMIPASDPGSGWVQTNTALYVQLFWQKFINDPDLLAARQGGLVVPVGFSYAAGADAANYVQILPCMYQNNPPPALSFHLYDNSYNILWEIQDATRRLGGSYLLLPEINGETMYNDPLVANSHNQALTEAGSGAIPLQYVTAWFYNDVPGPGNSVPAQPRPAPVDVGNYRTKGW